MSAGFAGELRTTGIGSLPFESPEEAAEYVLGIDLSIPFWPQLPKRDFRELMIPQYSEGMPCVTVDAAAGRASCASDNKASDLETFYEDFLAEYDPKLRKDAGLTCAPKI